MALVKRLQLTGSRTSLARSEPEASSTAVKPHCVQTSDACARLTASVSGLGFHSAAFPMDNKGTFHKTVQLVTQSKQLGRQKARRGHTGDPFASLPEGPGHSPWKGSITGRAPLI